MPKTILKAPQPLIYSRREKKILVDSKLDDPDLPLLQFIREYITDYLYKASQTQAMPSSWRASMRHAMVSFKWHKTVYVEPERLWLFDEYQRRSIVLCYLLAAEFYSDRLSLSDDKPSMGSVLKEGLVTRFNAAELDEFIVSSLNDFKKQPARLDLAAQRLHLLFPKGPLLIELGWVESLHDSVPKFLFVYDKSSKESWLEYLSDSLNYNSSSLHQHIKVIINHLVCGRGEERMINCHRLNMAMAFFDYKQLHKLQTVVENYESLARDCSYDPQVLAMIMKHKELSLTLAHLPYNSARIEEELRARFMHAFASGHERMSAKRVTFAACGPRFLGEPEKYAKMEANESLLKTGTEVLTA